MHKVELVTLSMASGKAELYPLPIEPEGPPCTVKLRCLPGASGLHLAVAVDGVIRRRAEIEATGGETVEIEIEMDSGLDCHFTSEGATVLTLPPNDTFMPHPPFHRQPLESGLDLAIVLDGTLRFYDAPDVKSTASPLSKLLFGDKERRDEFAQKLWSFVEALDASGLRTTVIAFGDEPLNDAAAADLKPNYHLFPRRVEERALRSAVPSSLVDALTSIPSTPGADFVDALADALASCRELRWRPSARKIVLVVGDSPGHSLLQPAPWGCDARVREHDVDVEALRLHGKGVEIATIYCSPPKYVYDYYFEAQLREIFDFASKQYRRLASIPALAFEFSNLDPEKAAAKVASLRGWVARGPALGELNEVNGMKTLDLAQVALPENEVEEAAAPFKGGPVQESAAPVTGAEMPSADLDENNSPPLESKLQALPVLAPPTLEIWEPSFFQSTADNPLSQFSGLPVESSDAPVAFEEGAETEPPESASADSESASSEATPVEAALELPENVEAAPAEASPEIRQESPAQLAPPKTSIPWDDTSA